MPGSSGRWITFERVEMTTYQIFAMAMSATTLAGVTGIVVWIFKFAHWKGTVDRDRKHNIIEHIRFEREHTALEQEFHRHVAKNRYQGV